MLKVIFSFSSPIILKQLSFVYGGMEILVPAKKQRFAAWAER